MTAEHRTEFRIEQRSKRAPEWQPSGSAHRGADEHDAPVPPRLVRIVEDRNAKYGPEWEHRLVRRNVTIDSWTPVEDDPSA